MKCEICHNHDAQTAVNVEADGELKELYVCNECARRERVGRQNKSQRTRKAKSGESSGGEEAPAETENGQIDPILEAFVNAVSGLASDIERACRESASQAQDVRKLGPAKGRKARDAFHVRGRLHLEGLNLIGEMEAVHRAMRALGMKLEGIDADGIRDTGHAYLIAYTGSEDRARRVEAELLEQERNARVRLFEEMPRVFADSLCRALAILKNCRLLTPGELFDLLSPLRLAAYEEMLDGINVKEIDTLMDKMDLSSAEDNVSIPERDNIDAERADQVNKRFVEVVLNESAEGRFL